ncbi:hypothetical protein EJB05_38796 [Eragrostis curvula]|uniref:RING-type domain-containing protein n=1 Tax=Eragrostis curvula TaxID=38414 RepID=A0A5J9TVA6_9POAL|nr:hypothetical protein EJB05_38796 [Eragrostis curvula]
MNSDRVLEVPDTPDRIKQSTCPVSNSVGRRDIIPPHLEVPDTPDRIKQSTGPVSNSVGRRDINPSPRLRLRVKIRNKSIHDPSSQADACRVLPAPRDADNIFRQADAARSLAFSEVSEAKLPSQKSNKTIGKSLQSEKRVEKCGLDQSSSISSHINCGGTGGRSRSCQIRDGEVSKQDANERNANFIGVGSALPTIPVGKPRNRTGTSIPNKLKAVVGADVCPGLSSEEVKGEVITNMVVTGPSSPHRVVPQRHMGQKKLVRNGCISPSNVTRRNIIVDEKQEMCSTGGVLHHPHPQRDVFGRVGVIDLTDNSPTIIRHGSAVNISADIEDTRAGKRLRTERANEALVPPSEYLANGSNDSGINLSGRNSKGKEVSHDMLHREQIVEANSRRVCLNAAGTSVINSSSSCVNPEDGWRTTHNHTSRLPISSMGRTSSRHGQESGSSTMFDLDHGSAGDIDLISEAIAKRTERLGNRTTRIAGGRRKRALSSSHPGESSRHNIPVITIDDTIPEVGSSSSGRSDGTSVDPTMQAQFESDELLARQLQEQLYNETPRVAPTEDIDAVIAMSLQHEENTYRTTRAVRRPQYNTVRLLKAPMLRGAQGSRSNVHQNAVVRTSNTISRLQNTASVTLGLGAVLHRYSGIPRTQPNIDLNDYDALLALDENNHQHTGASESQINSLPQSVVQSNSIEEPCAVCLENPSVGDTIRHLPCFHKFHKECIDEWLRRKKLCPICKSGIR